MRRKYQIGAKVRASHDHGTVKRGDQGIVQEARAGLYYGVYFGGGNLVYSPQEHLDADGDVDGVNNDNDADDQPAAASQSWEELMEEVAKLSSVQ